MIALSPKIGENRVVYVPRTAPHIQTFTILHDAPDYSVDYIEDYVPIRILCPTELNNAEKQYSEAIFHIHGGGFISMSSNSHQGYTRHWAKDLQVPIFSVDYKLAPKFPYPRALDDV